MYVHSAKIQISLHIRSLIKILGIQSEEMLGFEHPLKTDQTAWMLRLI